jgi:molybdopterin-guanine dinucleotide biosynthesis protein A
MTFDAIVLAGGRGSRLGGVSKPDVLVAGRSLLDRALDAAAGARHVVVVGPPGLARPGVVTVLEDPPFGGPVAGIDVGLAALDRLHSLDADADAGQPGSEVPGSEVPGSAMPRAAVPVLVLACDIPGAAGAVPALLAALADPDVDGAQLVRDGRAQLVAVHRAPRLRAALEAVRHADGVRGVAVRALHAGLRMAPVPDDAGLSADADTWDDVARLESALTGGTTMTATTPADLDRWVALVADALGVDPGVLDRDLVLDLTRDVAHTVTRPAVPLTTFLMGVAVGAGSRDRAALDAAAAKVAEATRAWAQAHPGA